MCGERGRNSCEKCPQVGVQVQGVYEFCSLLCVECSFIKQ